MDDDKSLQIRSSNHLDDFGMFVISYKLFENIQQILMLKQLLPCSSSTIIESLDIHTPSQSSRISSHIGSRLEPESTVKHQSKKQSAPNVISLTSINRKNKIEINQQALEIITAYSKWQVGFCGVIQISRKRNKVVKQIIEMPEVSPSKADNLQSNQKGLLINKVPFVLSNNKRMFFVQYHRDSAAINFKQKQLIGLLASLCSSVILCTDNTDGLIIVADMLKSSSKQLGVDSLSQLWPHTCYLLTNKASEKLQLQTISSMFHRTLSINSRLPQSEILQELLMDMAANYSKKYYQKLEITAPIMCKALISLTTNANSDNCCQRYKLAQVYSQHVQQIYDQSYKYLTQLYDETAHNYLKQQKAYSIDFVLDICDRVRTEVMAQFQVHLSQSFDQTYLAKLQEYIDQKERLILEVNKKKNKYMLKQEIQSIAISKKQVLSQKGIEEIIKKIMSFAENYDHSATDTVSNFLLKLTYRIEKYRLKIIKKGQQEAQKPQATKQILQNLCDKRYQLQILQDQRQGLLFANRSREKEYDSLKQKRKQLKERLISLKKQLEIVRVRAEDKIITKKALEKQSQKMLEVIRQLQEKYRDNQEILRGVRSQIDFEPSIDRMERRLSNLTRECELLEAKKEVIESYMTLSNPQDYTFNQQ